MQTVLETFIRYIYRKTEYISQCSDPFSGLAVKNKRKKLVLWIAKNALILKIPSTVGRIEWVICIHIYVHTYICMRYMYISIYTYTHIFAVYGTIYRPRKKIHDADIFLIIFSQRTRCVAQYDATYWKSNRANTMYRGYT